MLLDFFSEDSVKYVAGVYQSFLWKNAIHEKIGPNLVKTPCKVQNSS